MKKNKMFLPLTALVVAAVLSAFTMQPKSKAGRVDPQYVWFQYTGSPTDNENDPSLYTYVSDAEPELGCGGENLVCDIQAMINPGTDSPGHVGAKPDFSDPSFTSVRITGHGVQAVNLKDE